MNSDDEKLNALMSRYSLGDDAAFGPIYALIGGRLYSFCERLTRGRTEVDDVFQETFIKLHRSRGLYAPGSTAQGWIFAIARSVFLDAARRKKRRGDESLANVELAVADQAAAGYVASPQCHSEVRELANELDRTLCALPETQRSAYLLLHDQGVTIAEAAAVLRTTEVAVKLRAHRACEALRATVWRVSGLRVASRSKGRSRASHEDSSNPGVEHGSIA